MEMALYDIQNLKHRYENGPVTVDIDSLAIQMGSVTGLVGPNGSGKSTLLKLLAFLEPCCQGKIIYGGRECSVRTEGVRKDITYLLQDSYLLKRTVYDNIAYGLKLRGIKDLEARVIESMERVGLSPKKFRDRLWFRLSGGEVQRVALAARLALHPKVLLLDEPTANVDEASAQLVKEAALSAWKEWGATVIVATHDIVWLYEVSTDIISLYRGKIVGRGALNIIQGIWRAEGDFAVRVLGNGQKITGLYAGSREISAGVIDPSDVTVNRMEPSAAEGSDRLRGVVIQMALERGTGCVLVSVDVGDMIIKSRMAISEAEEERLCPATQVWLSVQNNKIRWL